MARVPELTRMSNLANVNFPTLFINWVQESHIFGFFGNGAADHGGHKSRGGGSAGGKKAEAPALTLELAPFCPLK